MGLYLNFIRKKIEERSKKKAREKSKKKAREKSKKKKRAKKSKKKPRGKKIPELHLDVLLYCKPIQNPPAPCCFVCSWVEADTRAAVRAKRDQMTIKGKISLPFRARAGLSHPQPVARIRLRHLD
jgi:hypothetical protein